jgi:hypothetical protein
MMRVRMLNDSSTYLVEKKDGLFKQENYLE